jgi:hypothetical protein
MRKLQGLTQQEIQQILDVATHLDPQQPFGPQIEARVDDLGLTTREWQTQPILVNPPSLSVFAAALLAELHGRMGYFPPLIRLRRVGGAIPPRFEVAEVMDLQSVRDRARARR